MLSPKRFPGSEFIEGLMKRLRLTATFLQQALLRKKGRNMDLLAPIARRVIAPAWAFWERSPYLRHYRRLLRTQYHSPEAIGQRQWDRLVQIVRHAYRSSPFWRADCNRPELSPSKGFRFPSSVRLRCCGEEIFKPIAAKCRRAIIAAPRCTNARRPARPARRSQSWSTTRHNNSSEPACSARTNGRAGDLANGVAAVWGNPEYVKHGLARKTPQWPAGTQDLSRYAQDGRGRHR